MEIESMEQKVLKAFPECDVLISDLTGSMNHFEIRIAAPEFQKMNRIQRHQAVMNLFDQELKSGEIHALSIKAIEK